MSDNPFDSLPPAPDDLWPKVSAQVPPHSIWGKENYPVRLLNMGEILGRAVHSEMQTAGEYAGKATVAPADLLPSQLKVRRSELTFHSRWRAESAARLLHFYQAVYAEATQNDAPTILPSPAQLKEAATKSYRMGLRDEISVQQQIQALKGEQPGFNDELYSHLIKKAPAEGAKIHR